MRFQLVAPSGVKFDADVYEVVLPTASGDIAVFAQHMPLVSVAVPGIITVRHKPGDADDKQEVFATEGGIIEVGKQGVRVLVDEATHEQEIYLDEARQALERAQALKLEARDKLSLEHAQAVVDRQAVRLKVAELKRHHRERPTLPPQ